MKSYDIYNTIRLCFYEMPFDQKAFGKLLETIK